MAIGDGLALSWFLALEGGDLLWCRMAVGQSFILQCRLATRGSMPAEKTGAFCPLTLKVARVRSYPSGEGMKNGDPFLALFPIQHAYTHGYHFTILTAFVFINPANG